MYTYLWICIHIYIYMHVYKYIYIYMYTHELLPLKQIKSWEIRHRALHTEWQRPLGCPKLQIIFRKRAINYRALLRKMTYEDKASYNSMASSIHKETKRRETKRHTTTTKRDRPRRSCTSFMCIYVCTSICVYTYIYYRHIYHIDIQSLHPERVRSWQIRNRCLQTDLQKVTQRDL